MSAPVAVIAGQWHARASDWIARLTGQQWTPLHLGSGYTEADAISRAEALGLIVATPRSKIRRIK